MNTQTKRIFLIAWVMSLLAGLTQGGLLGRWVLGAALIAMGLALLLVRQIKRS